jgi:hypothetical protein
MVERGRSIIIIIIFFSPHLLAPALPGDTPKSKPTRHARARDHRKIFLY